MRMLTLCLHPMTLCDTRQSGRLRCADIAAPQTRVVTAW